MASTPSPQWGMRPPPQPKVPGRNASGSLSPPGSCCWCGCSAPARTSQTPWRPPRQAHPQPPLRSPPRRPRPRPSGRRPPRGQHRRLRSARRSRPPPPGGQRQRPGRPAPAIRPTRASASRPGSAATTALVAPATVPTTCTAPSAWSVPTSLTSTATATGGAAKPEASCAWWVRWTFGQRSLVGQRPGQQRQRHGPRHPLTRVLHKSW
jgi:hypothetical protein